uniref:Non-ribosomal peptide synthetase n=1 Tax=uncultured bacterium AB_1383 TaxID=1630010 RepID=A0A0E3M0J0_9BACT|nr:non-ribosomal peptide synthetase [uncultured bacterium AB_1383]
MMLEHAGVANLAWWMRRSAGLGPGDVTPWSGPPAFDISVLELWSSLLAGARVEILPGSRLAPHEMRRWLLDRGVTVAVFAVPVAEELLALEWPADAPLRVVLTGADRLRRRPAASTPFVLLNDYGPTETTVLASSGPVPREGEGLPAIGAPLPNTRLYVLDAGGRLVPEGVTGELYVAGAGLARGYLGRPEQTAERFLPDPFGPTGSRCYRTGDLVRWRRGELEFVGRADQQVKVRGFRVEPGEVEVALRALPGVRDAVVALVEDGGPARLAGYVLAPELAPADGRALQEALGRSLPAYMLPADVVVLPEFPLTSTGKVDRARLPVPEAAQPAQGGDQGPRSEAEALVAAVWSRVLGRERIGVRDDFFKLGGHSLLAMRAATELRRELGVEVHVRALFENPTVEEFAARVLGELPAAIQGSTPT